MIESQGNWYFFDYFSGCQTKHQYQTTFQRPKQLFPQDPPLMVALDVGFACTCQVSWGPDHLHQMEPQKKKKHATDPDCWPKRTALPQHYGSLLVEVDHQEVFLKRKQWLFPCQGSNGKARPSAKDGYVYIYISIA